MLSCRFNDRFSDRFSDRSSDRFFRRACPCLRARRLPAALVPPRHTARAGGFLIHFLTVVSVVSAAVFPACDAAASPAAIVRQPPQSLIDAATQFLQVHIARSTHANTPASTARAAPHITITLPKRAATLPACTALTTFATGGNPDAKPGKNYTTARIRPRMTVALRCAAPKAWTLYAQASISLPGRYYVAARPIAPGQPLKASDLAPRDGNLLTLPPGTITDPASVAGFLTDQRIARGQLLRADTLRATTTITRGQTVTLTARGAGFEVRQTGQALAAGAPGQRISVRTASGQTVTAVVRDGGSVEVGV